MSILRPHGPFRILVLVLTVVMLASTLTGCDAIDRITGSTDAGEVEKVTDVTTYGACLPTYGSEVDSAGVSYDGSRVLYLSGVKPGNWPDDKGWGSDDKALYVVEGGQTRYIASSWDAIDEIPQFSTPEPNSTPRPQPLEEELVYAWISQPGDRFLVAVGRVGVGGLFAKLYSGAITDAAAGSQSLMPGDGMTLVKVNDYVGTEGIDAVSFSPDGSKVAVTVSIRGEVRLYDLDTGELTVYSLDEDGETIIEHELPQPPTSLNVTREPAIARVQEIVWSPEGERLALSFETGVGSTALGLLDIDSGEMTVVRTFQDSTLPHVAWHTSGASLFVMTTRLVQGTIFGNTEIRHLAAVEDGRDIHSGGELKRPQGYRTEPAWLTDNADNEHFFFTWEGLTYRLTIANEDASLASYVPVTSSEYIVAGRGVTVSPESERLVFVIVDGSRSMVGERLHSLANGCPLDPVAGTSDAAEGEGDEPPAEAGAEEAEAAEPVEDEEAADEAADETADDTAGEDAAEGETEGDAAEDAEGEGEEGEAAEGEGEGDG